MKGHVKKERVIAVLLSTLVTLSIILPTLADGSIAGG